MKTYLKTALFAAALLLGHIILLGVPSPASADFILNGVSFTDPTQLINPEVIGTLNGGILYTGTGTTNLDVSGTLNVTGIGTIKGGIAAAPTAASLTVKSGGTLAINSTGSLLVNGNIEVQSGSEVEIGLRPIPKPAPGGSFAISTDWSDDTFIHTVYVVGDEGVLIAQSYSTGELKALGLRPPPAPAPHGDEALTLKALIYAESIVFETGSTLNFDFGNYSPVGGDIFSLADCSITLGENVDINDVIITGLSEGMMIINSQAILFNPVPEPSTMLLFGTGLAGLVGVLRKRKKA